MIFVDKPYCVHRGEDCRCKIKDNKFCSNKLCGVIQEEDCPANKFEPKETR